MSDQNFNCKILKCDQRNHLSSLVTLLKRACQKKFVIYCNEKIVIDFFVDIFDYLNIDSTSNYDEYLNRQFRVCFIDKSFGMEISEIKSDFVLFFDLPKIDLIERLSEVRDKEIGSVVFLVRDCEREWVKENLIEKLNAKELNIAKGSLIDVEGPMKKGTKKLFALQRDAQLAYKAFMKSYSVDGHASLDQLRLKDIANNFGLDIPPKINDFELLLKQKEPETTDVPQKRRAIVNDIPTKLRKIR